MLAGVLLWLVEAAGGVVESDGHGFSTGYLALYLLAFLASVLGSVFVTRIRGVALTAEECWSAGPGSGWT